MSKARQLNHEQGNMKYRLMDIKTIKNRVMLTHTLWDKARRLGYVERDAYSPTEDVELPKKQPKKYKAYDYQEVELMLKLAEEYGNPHLILQIQLAIFTGSRRSEMAALTFEDVDFDKQILHITKAKVRGMHEDVVKETKTEAGVRDIPISSALMKTLKAHRREYFQNRIKNGKKFNDSKYLFCDEFGNPFIVSSLSHRWQRFQEFAEPRGLRKVPLHFLRHSYASLLLANQVDIKTAQALMGHSSISMTADIYADAYLENKRDAVRVLDELLQAKA